ncbi:MAG: hypothetical protein KOO69_03520 [Victivallales bacterium]|nr:hypothetical protein [Victivallales bacterium]
MNWKKYERFFKESEFVDDLKNCWMKEDHMDMLFHARLISGTSYLIASGCRNPAQNKREGGKDDSDHLTGEGSDIAFFNNWERFRILYGLFEAGFKRIGVSDADMFIHAGSNLGNPQDVYWSY